MMPNVHTNIVMLQVLLQVFKRVELFKCVQIHSGLAKVLSHLLSYQDIHELCHKPSVRESPLRINY